MTDNSKTITVTPETYKWLELFKTTLGEELEEEFVMVEFVGTHVDRLSFCRVDGNTGKDT